MTDSRNWKKTSERIAYKGRIFTYREVESISPDKAMEGSFDVLDFSPWVNIVAITKDGEMIFVEQFRQGAQKVTLEIPGGAVDKGEEFLAAAKRELREETGYESSEWVKLGEVSPNPAIMSNRCATYLAKNCEQTSETDFDHLEDIEIKTIACSEVHGLVKTGEIDHSLVIAAFYFWQNYKV